MLNFASRSRDPDVREIREAKFGIRNSEIGKRKRAERTNENLEEVQMYESTNVVVGPMVSVGR